MRGSWLRGGTSSVADISESVFGSIAGVAPRNEVDVLLEAGVEASVGGGDQGPAGIAFPLRNHARNDYSDRAFPHEYMKAKSRGFSDSIQSQEEGTVNV